MSWKRQLSVGKRKFQPKEDLQGKFSFLNIKRTFFVSYLCFAVKVAIIFQLSSVIQRGACPVERLTLESQFIE